MPIRRSFLLLAALAAPTAFAQNTQVPSAVPQSVPAPAKPIAFDVVSVKPNKSDDAHPGLMLRPDGFDAENVTPFWVMSWAFGQGSACDDSYFSGLPGWANTERFDIIAKVAGPDVPVWGHMSGSEKQRMIREVLADRFKLQTHMETHEQPVYALVLAKGGAKLKPAAPAAGASDKAAQGGWGRSRTGIVAGNITMVEFCAHLGTMGLGRPVQDQTGLNGRYDLKLDFAPINTAPINTAASATQDGSATTPDAFPDIFTAVQEQLGLKLVSAKGPVPVLVIDHIERPTAD